MTQDSSHRAPVGRLHRVVVIVDGNSNPFELGCATEVFGLRRPELGRDLYDFRLCSPEPETSMRDGFFTLTGVAGLEAAESADTLVVPNRPDVEVPRRPAVLDAVRRAHARGARLVGFCSGAFTLAEAGVLDGRRATAHWQWADAFRARFPAVRLEEDVLFVDDGDVLTAAGSAAALDLGLHIVRRDHGAEVANSVSRRLVFAAHRDGGQRQFIERPVPDVPNESLASVLAWAQERLDAPLTVSVLAARASVSPATLHRRFREQLGTTPLAWLTRERLALACRLIERGEARFEVVARRSGLGTAANLRALMRRETGLAPSAYRRRFGPGAATGAAPAGRSPGP
ncbi:helix-turn-helix domain-containing protein [Streptomyces somaliensis DSM 40738]|uniref:Helix-turn-helix domain-containing protein n=1 Tax=Streptomyces somaliensis (strain ATCC 33201 / DSM 40738 / JCM 12659 / KCTC 9044 / NCTC 11332 / NRRL B-12077 / IP 733) TaxID=1134445 RepID=A0AA44DBV0_STRE0|nr:helix-turn-helix domain-containing protein [Streptomyces somaliensis]MCQ0025335.1 helix-turn-helix domain-containing protein [Streptomyces somaliensis DSM 40738]NKY13619.1 helix-turn-helix domain-containing protein [Streptomyces somaliensis DSM 40738]